MDEFLREIYTSVFYRWILLQQSDDYDVYINPKDYTIIVIETDCCYSEITFNKMCIIEMSVKNKTNDEYEFYLHFQMTNIKHALELYNEMLDCIMMLVNQPKVKVLLSCSGGLTTSYFVDEINKAVNLLKYNIEVSAVGYNDLFYKGLDYDIILLAPQISYSYNKVKGILKDKVVLKIPPKIYANYNVGKLLQLIDDASSNRPIDSTRHKLPTMKTKIHISQPVLCLAIFRNSNRIHIFYRLYGKHMKIVGSNEIIKPTITLQDIFDTIDTVLVQYPIFETISLSTPGILNDGQVTSTSILGYDDINIRDALVQRYNKKCVCVNDVNAAAVGYYATQDRYSSISFIFKPSMYMAGVGNIINGELVTGLNNLAGEVQYLPLNLSAPLSELYKTPEGTLEFVSKVIVSVISIISPEAFVVFCMLIPDVEELKHEIEKYLPKEYIPPIIKVDEEMEDETMLGTLILAVEK